MVVRDKGDGGFEGVGGRAAVEGEILGGGIAGEDLGEDLALDKVGVGGDIFNELENGVVFLNKVVIGAYRGWCFGGFRHFGLGMNE